VKLYVSETYDDETKMILRHSSIETDETGTL